MNIKRSVFAVAPLLLAGVAAAQNNPPTWSSTASYSEGDVVKIGINLYQALATNLDKNPTAYNGDWELYRLRANNTVSPPVYRVTIGSGQSFPNLYDAWQYVKNAVIDQGATLQLYINTSHAALTESFGATFNLDHPFGGQIQIVGDNPTNINLNFSEPAVGNGFNAVQLDTGHTLALLENVQVNGANDSTGQGISVDGSATMTLQNVFVNTFGTGVSVTNAGKLTCTVPQVGNSITVSAFLYNGVIAVDSSYISCPSLALNGTTGTLNGVVAERHSEIVADNATVSNLGYAYNSIDHSSLRVQSSKCINVAALGYYAFNQSFIDAEMANGPSYSVGYGAFIDAQNSNATDSNVTVDSWGSHVAPIN